jgi:hypothetical protein
MPRQPRSERWSGSRRPDAAVAQTAKTLASNHKTASRFSSTSQPRSLVGPGTTAEDRRRPRLLLGTSRGRLLASPSVMSRVCYEIAVRLTLIALRRRARHAFLGKSEGEIRAPEDTRNYGCAHKKKGRLHCYKRSKFREETPMEGGAIARTIDTTIANGGSTEHRYRSGIQTG